MSNDNLNIDRINELAKKEQGLTELKSNRNYIKYLEAFRKGFKQQIESTKVIDPEGNDVHLKIKKIQEQNKN